MHGPLAGIRVLDLTTALAGPLATLRLGDLGADVFKIEGPNAPDSTRNMVIGGVPISSSTSSYLALNRNKKTLILDLKTEAGQEVFRQLVRQCDVLVTNYLSSTIKRLGLAWSVVSKANPKLTAVYVSAFSEADEKHGEAGIDLLLQAHSGLIYTGGNSTRPYSVAPVFAVDIAASHLATEAAMAGLVQRARSGTGAPFNISMLTAALELQLQEFSTFATTGHLRKIGEEHSVSLYMEPPYGVHETADGLIAVARARLDLIGPALGLAELAELAKGRPPEERHDAMADWRDTIMRCIQSRLSEMTTKEALAALASYNVWSAKVRGYDELLTDPGVLDRMVHIPLPESSAFKTLGPTVGDGRETRSVHSASSFGQDSREILEYFGYSGPQIDALIEASIVMTSTAVPSLRR